MKRFGLAVLGLLLAGPVWGANWYVRPIGGSYGAENGTSYADAWEGFGNVVWGAGGVSPGDTLCVQGVHREVLTVGTDGTSEAGVEVSLECQGIAGEIVGSDVVTGWSGPDGNGEYSAALADHPWVVTVDGTVWREGALGTLGAAEWDHAAGVLYLGSDPAGATIEAGKRSIGVEIADHDYVTIKGGTVRGIAKAAISTDGGAIHIGSGAVGVTVEAVSIKASRFAIMNYSGSGAGFLGNEINYCSDGIKSISANGITVTNNVISNINWNGIQQIWSSVDGEAIAATDCTGPISISKNLVTSSWFGVKSYLSVPGGVVTLTMNHILDCKNGCIAVNGITGGSYESVLVAMNNMRQCKNSGSTKALQISSGDPSTLSGSVAVLNNTCNDSDWCYFLGWGDVTFKNNISARLADGGYHVYAKTANSITTSNNVYWDDDGGAEWWRAPALGGTSIYATWVSQVTDAGSAVTDPMIRVDGHLRPTSPCIDAGTDVGLISDFSGHPIRGLPDIGAYEWQSLVRPGVWPGSAGTRRGLWQ